MKIPHKNLSAFALREVVEEFVTRDGTDHSEMNRRIEVVLEQLGNGTLELHFDDQTGTCNIILSD